MIKIIPFFLCIIGFLISCRTDNESFTTIKSPASPLISGLQSYWTISQVEENFLAELKFDVIEDSKLPIGDKRPPYNFYIISIPDFAHLDQLGELNLTFFNNRLMSTTFFPNNINNYILELNKSNYNFNLNTLNGNSGSQSKMIPPFTEVNFALDYQKKYYVRWSDTRLNDEHQKWISRYAQLQMPNQLIPNPVNV